MSGRSRLIVKNLNQTAVYWANPVPDGEGGRSFDDAVELACRWDHKQELFIDANAKEVRSQAVVYVNQDVDTGEYLYLGELTDLSSAEEGDPLSIAGAYEIRAFEKIADLSGTRFVRKAWL